MTHFISSLCTAGILYTPPGDFDGYDIIELTVEDSSSAVSGKRSEVSVINIHVVGVNDAPVLTLVEATEGGEGSSREVYESSITKIDGVAVSDIDAYSSFLTVTVSCDPGAGRISSEGKYFSGISVESKVEEPHKTTLRGSVSALSSAMSTGYLKYLPAEDFSSTTGDNAIRVRVTDEGSLSDEVEIIFNVISVYNPPTVTFNTAHLETVEDVDDDLGGLTILVDAREVDR